MKAQSATVKPTLTLLTALLLAPLGALHAGDVDGLLARCQVIKTSPTPVANTGGYGTMSQCLLLGNGNLMVSVAGGPETITLFLGKTDYWRDRGHGKGGALWQSGNVLPGWLNLAFPAMKDAKFEQVQDMALMQRVWFGCLYVFGCANKVGQWPAGCNGWPINDDVPWGGDYHWNYNHEAPYYGAYTANRLEGITIADSATHSLMLVSPYKAGHPNEVKRTKIFTWRANGDGINPFGNRLIEDPRPTLQQFFICMTMPGPYSKSAEKRVAGDLSGILFQFQAVNAATNLIRQNTP